VNNATRLVTRRAVGALAAAGLIGLLAAHDAAADPPDTIVLSGTVRDFRKAHVDFNVVPADGPGHCAAMAELLLGAEAVPVYTGRGYKVGTQWRNVHSEPIAPHLYDMGRDAAGVKTHDDPSVHDNAIFDTWRSTVGPYGGGNVGPAPTIEVGAPMPEIREPTGLGPSVGNVILVDTTLSGTLHCDDLEIRGVVAVSGAVTVLCEDDFSLDTHADLVLLPGATLDLYVREDVAIMPHSNLNAVPGIPDRVLIYVLGNDTISVGQPHGVAYAVVVAPHATMNVQPNANFYGAFVGDSMKVSPGGGFHLDTDAIVPLGSCGNEIKDTLGAAAAVSSGGVSSADTFDQWYRDILGVSLSAFHAITLVRNGYGIYEYDDDAFYPIDGVLFGNEGDGHNRYFTYTIAAYFQYESCAGQFFEFRGADDAWMFVNETLAMDLGGLVAGTEQVVELDRLGLTDGEVYEMTFYFAHRYPAPPAFHLRTNVPLWSDTEAFASRFPCD
jgi:fibro-slime domain-containing protein